MPSRKKPARRKLTLSPLAGRPALPLSEVRSQLSPLVRTVAQQKGAVGITVRGKVQAYLIAGERFEEAYLSYRRLSWPIKGSLRLVGSPGSVGQAVQQGRREMLQDSLREWDELIGE